MAWGRQKVRDEDGNERRLKDVPDAFGRDKGGRGRIPKGGHTADTARDVVKYEKDGTGQKVYKKVKGGRTLNKKEMDHNARMAKEHQKRIDVIAKTAKKNRKLGL